MKNLGVIPPNSSVAWFEGRAIVVHPEGPPFCIWPDARREMLPLRDGLPVVVTTTGPTTFTLSAGTTAENISLTSVGRVQLSPSTDPR